MTDLTLTGLYKTYGVTQALKPLNLTIPKGSFTSILGPSGSGKTTLLNVIGGLDSYEEGEMYIEGKPTSHYIKSDWDEYVAKYVSFIFQDYNILESFMVFENIEFALTSVKDLKERKRRALEIAERVGLKDRLNTKGVKLSGGEKQRIAVARALVNHPAVVLADEPSGSLDSQNKEELHRLFFDLRDQLQQTFVIVTHDEQLASQTDRMIHIRDGMVMKED